MCTTKSHGKYKRTMYSKVPVLFYSLSATLVLMILRQMNKQIIVWVWRRATDDGIMDLAQWLRKYPKNGLKGYILCSKFTYSIEFVLWCHRDHGNNSLYLQDLHSVVELPLEQVVTKCSPVRTLPKSQSLFYVLKSFLKMNKFEIGFIYHSIHPFQTYSSVFFIIFSVIQL